ncbi:MAG: DUF3619 family protein [Rubrivivax sp.]
MIRTTEPTDTRRAGLESRAARLILDRLDASDGPLPHDIRQRLQFARGRALEAALAARRQTARAHLPVAQGNGSIALGESGWWRLAAFAPLVVLVCGLLLIDESNRSQLIHAAAEVDAVLLADELPPAAYSDPGFAEFLKRTDP